MTGIVSHGVEALARHAKCEHCPAVTKVQGSDQAVARYIMTLLAAMSAKSALTTVG